MSSREKLDPKSSPNLLERSTSFGGRRLNKVPLAIIGVMTCVVVSVIFYVIHKKGQQNTALSKIQAEEGVGQGPTPAIIPNEMKKEMADSHMIASEKAIGVSYEGIKPVADGGKVNGELESERKRIRQWRFQQLQKALTSETEVGVQNLYNSKLSGNPSGRNVQRDSHQQGVNPSGGSFTDLLKGKDQNQQERKEEFLKRNTRYGYLNASRQQPLSPFEIKTGAIIPGVMVSGINSDLPGQIVGQVSQNVYDSATGDHLLIPQGTKVIGSYDSFVAVGQERALVVWNRLVFPDSSTLELAGMSGTDQAGYAGFEDQVDNHYFKIFGSAIMMSVVGAGYQLSQPQPKQGEQLTPQQILAAQMGANFNQVGTEMIRRNMNIQPTIKIRPGYRFTVMVNKDIILTPWSS